VIRVAAVDEDVVLAELGAQLGDGGIHHGSGNHQPDGARLLELGDEVVDGSGPGGTLAGKLLHRIRAAVIDNALVAIFLETPNHIGAHPAQPDHAELHGESLREKLKTKIECYARACLTAFESFAGHL